MKNITDGIYVGSDADYPLLAEGPWAHVHAAKTWHAKLLGYTGAAPVNIRERYVAKRDNELFLNLVDAKKQKANLVMPILEEAKKFIDVRLMHEEKVFVHCNKGRSRAPAVVLWWWRIEATPEPFEDVVKFLFKDYDVDRESGIMKLVEEKWGHEAAKYQTHFYT